MTEAQNVSLHGLGPMQTSLGRALFLLLGGFISSAQLGKAFVAMPLLQAEMALPLTIVSFLIATFATLGALFGMGTGLVVKRIGSRQALIGGMSIMAFSSLAGSLAQSPEAMMVTRVIEGIGFLGAVIAIPDVLGHVATGKDRNFFLGLWGTFMPTGTALMLLIGPALPLIGWRNLWVSQAVLALSYACLAYVYLPNTNNHAPAGAPRLLETARKVLANRESRLLSAVFGLYTFQYFILAGFLPVILVSTLNLPLERATLFTAAAVAANAGGNVCAGLLARAGFPLWVSMGASLASYALLAPLLYSLGISAEIIAILAAVNLWIAGLLPGSIFAAVPRLVRAELVTPTMGLIQQTSNIGQFLGPVAAGYFVTHFGWSAIPILLVPMVMIGLWSVLALRPLFKTSP
jgi:MFS family permease